VVPVRESEPIELIDAAKEITDIDENNDDRERTDGIRMLEGSVVSSALSRDRFE